MGCLLRNAVVTGATGFVGRALCAALRARGVAVRAVIRATRPDVHADEIVCVGDLSGTDVDWPGVVRGVDTVFHLAAHVHVLDRRHRLDLDRFRAVNRDATARLGRAAAEAGVEHFVYLSTIGVNGTRTTVHPFTENDPPQPVSPYTISKWEGEVALREIASEGSMRLGVVRAPLVYGPGVEAKFLMLLRLVDRGVPLPFASVRNARSMIFVENLTDALVRVAEDPAALSLYLAADRETSSTPDLIRRVAALMRRPARLFPVPESVLRGGASLLRRRDLVGPLLDSLIVSSDRIGDQLGWRPPFSLEEGLRDTVRWYEKRV